MTKPLIIYHGNCTDGFCAAWVAARALGDVELFAGEHGKEPPYDLARDRRVLIVDFSYPRQQMNRLLDAGGIGLSGHPRYGFTVLDHHKTAAADLRDFPHALFDMERSGAGLAWDYFHPHEKRPWLVDYVEDRDLWRFKLPDSQSISLWLRTLPFELEAWDEALERGLHDVEIEARGCKRYLDHYVRDMLRNVRKIEIWWQSSDDQLLHPDRSVPTATVNLGYTGVSDVLDAAIRETGLPMALGWHVAVDGRYRCSLRSRSDFDCSVVAKYFGGGGHAQASGFWLDADEPLARELAGDSEAWS